MEQAELLRFALDILDDLQIPYALVGSIASGAYGEPRLTQDIAGIIKVSGDTLDRKYIEEWAAKLGLKDIWDAVLRRATASDGSAGNP